MKKTLLILISLCFTLAINAQTLMQVKQEGGYTNIRSGRGTNYRIVTKYKDGSNIYVGPSQNGWRAVYGSANGGFIGYISSSKVVSYGSASRSGSRGGGKLSYSFGYRLFGPDFDMARIKPEGGYTNLRNGNGKIIGKIKDGTPVYVTWGDDGTYYSVYNSNGKYLGLVHHTKIVNYWLDIIFAEESPRLTEQLLKRDKCFLVGYDGEAFWYGFDGKRGLSWIILGDW